MTATKGLLLFLLYLSSIVMLVFNTVVISLNLNSELWVVLIFTFQ